MTNDNSYDGFIILGALMLCSYALAPTVSVPMASAILEPLSGIALAYQFTWPELGF